MVAPLHGQNTAVARMFATEDSAPAAAASPAGSGAAASSVSTATVDLDALRKDLKQKQDELAPIKNAHDTKTFAINMNKQTALAESSADAGAMSGYNGHFTCEEGKVVVTKEGRAAGLVIENGELKSAPVRFWRAGEAFKAAQENVEKSLVAFQEKVEKLEADIKELEEKIAEEEGSGYGVLDCLLFPFTFTWKVVTTIGSFIYDLIFCNYGSGEDTTEGSATPEA